MAELNDNWETRDESTNLDILISKFWAKKHQSNLYINKQDISTHKKFDLYAQNICNNNTHSTNE